MPVATHTPARAKVTKVSAPEDQAGSAHAAVDVALGPHHEVVRALEGDHAKAHHPGEQRERIEQRPEAASVGRHHQVVEVERHAQQQVAEGHTEDDRRHRPADEEAPVPGAAPGRVLDFGAVVEADRAEEQRPQGGHHRPVETREGGGVDQRPGGENSPPAVMNQVLLVPIPTNIVFNIIYIMRS
jgi:hypothetical protein